MSSCHRLVLVLILGFLWLNVTSVLCCACRAAGHGGRVVPLTQRHFGRCPPPPSLIPGQTGGSPPAPVLVPERFLSSAFPLSCGVVGLVAIGLSGLFWALPPCPESPVCKEEFSGCDRDKRNVFSEYLSYKPPRTITDVEHSEREGNECPVPHFHKGIERAAHTLWLDALGGCGSPGGSSAVGFPQDLCVKLSCERAEQRCRVRPSAHSP